jgi:hypothetical protein
MNTIRLKSVRPFLITDVSLKSQPELNAADEKGIEHFLVDKVSHLLIHNLFLAFIKKTGFIVQVEEMIEQALDEYRELNEIPAETQNSELPLPLIRLKVRSFKHLRYRC